MINVAWDAVNASKLGPVLRDIDVTSDEDERWKQSQERISIMNMAAYETYKLVLQTLLDKSREAIQ